MIYSEHPYGEVQQVWPRLGDVMSYSDLIYLVSSFGWYWVIRVLHGLSIQWESPCLKELCAIERRKGRTEMSGIKTTERVMGRAKGFLVPHAGLFSSALHHFTPAEQLFWGALKSPTVGSPSTVCLHQSQILALAKIQSIVKHRSANPLWICLQLHVNMLFTEDW